MCAARRRVSVCPGRVRQKCVTGALAQVFITLCVALSTRHDPRCGLHKAQHHVLCATARTLRQPPTIEWTMLHTLLRVVRPCRALPARRLTRDPLNLSQITTNHEKNPFFFFAA